MVLAVSQGIVSGGNNNGRLKDLITRGSVNWARFKELLTYHDLEPIAYPMLKGSLSFVPEDLTKFFKARYFGSLISSQYLWREFLEISDRFKERGILILPIKGISFLADIYCSNPCRSMTDIDILVKEEDIREAKEILLGLLGYEERLDGLTEEYWLKKQCHLEFIKRAGKKTFFVDLHFGLDFKRKPREILPRLWDRVREADIDARPIRLLSPEDALFSLALHQRRFGNVLGLKNILDLALLLHKYKHGFDWGYVISEAKAGRMTANAFFILLQAKTFFEADIPKTVWRGLSVPFYKRILIKGLIEKDTFSSTSYQRLKGLYLKVHLLLYDSLWEPIEYILNIPQEQFAKFYSLDPYSKSTDLFYRSRLFYILLRTLRDLLRKPISFSFVILLSGWSFCRVC